MAKPGDIVLIEGTWCLVYQDRQTEKLHNIILTDVSDKGTNGLLQGKELEGAPIIFNLIDVLEYVKHET